MNTRYLENMSHTHASVLVHCVFSTKNRTNMIPDCDALWRYMTVLAKDNKVSLLAAGGTANHVHLLLALPPVRPLAKIIQELKGSSSRWLHEHGHRFAWQEGYGAFSVSSSNLDQVTRYIQNQEAHHRKIGFEEEFRAILLKHHVEFDPKYIFG